MRKKEDINDKGDIDEKRKNGDRSNKEDSD